MVMLQASPLFRSLLANGMALYKMEYSYGMTFKLDNVIAFLLDVKQTTPYIVPTSTIF